MKPDIYLDKFDWGVFMNEALKDLFEIDGQSAIVTGASSGLGIIFAEALAESGVNISIAARRFEQLEKIAADLRKRFNVYVAPLKCDVIQEDQVISMVNRAVEENGSRKNC